MLGVASALLLQRHAARAVGELGGGPARRAAEPPPERIVGELGAGLPLSDLRELAGVVVVQRVGGAAQRSPGLLSVGFDHRWAHGVRVLGLPALIGLTDSRRTNQRPTHRNLRTERRTRFLLQGGRPRNGDDPEATITLSNHEA